MHIRNFLKLTIAACAMITLSACGGDDDDDVPVVPPATIADVAKAGGFNALLAAVAKANIGSTLTDGSAQLTVFAPTDAAFNDLANKLGFADATAMVTALPASALQSILTYHVLPTKKLAADLVAGGSTQPTVYTFGGTPAQLTLDFTAGVKITDAALTTATVVTPNVAASNGVIHAIDKVLVPPGVLNIVQMAQVNPLFTSLVNAVVATNLQGTLSGAGPFTVFAPTNAAFAAAPQGLTTAQLSTVLTYHALSGQLLSTQIPFGTPVPTVAGQNITINSGTPPTIKDTTAVAARIVAVDVRASNGVIHVIDKVLIPTL